MLFSSNKNLYLKQNIYLKLFFVLYCIILISFGNFIHLALIFFLISIFLIFQPVIFLIWLKTISKLSIFLISYFIFSTIFEIDFMVQLRMFIKILIMLLLSVFLVKTVSTEYIYFNKLNQSNIMFQMIFFVLATMNFINFFYNSYCKLSAQNYPFKQIISGILADSVSEIDNIKLRIIKDLRANKKRITFFSFENLYLLFFITLLFLVSVI